MKWTASERVATSDDNSYVRTQAIVVGPDPSDLIAHTERRGGLYYMVLRRLQADGSMVEVASKQINTLYSEGCSVRQNNGEIAWVVYRRDTQTLLTFWYQNGTIFEGTPKGIVTPPGGASGMGFGSVGRIFSDGGGSFLVAGHRIDYVDGDGANRQTLILARFDWSGGASEPVEAWRVAQVGRNVPGTMANGFEMAPGNDGFWYLLYDREAEAFGNQQDAHLLRFTWPDIPDTAGHDIAWDGTPSGANYIEHLGYGWRSAVVGPDGARIRVSSVLDPDAFADWPYLPDTVGFGSYFDGALTRAHEWDPGVVVAFGAAEFGTGESFAGQTVSTSCLVAYINGTEEFAHQISNFDAYLYPQHFITDRPLRTNNITWGIATFDDYSGAADNTFIQAFGYEPPPPPAPKIGSRRRGQRAVFL